MNKETITKTLTDLFSLEDKVILMTGAAGAIGSEIAKCYANLGAKVVIADFNEEAMAEVKQEIDAAGGESTCMKLCLPDEDSIEEVVNGTIEKYGRIDVLANIAGINKRTLMTNGAEETFDRIIGVNLKGSYLISISVAKKMIALNETLPEEQKVHLSIINVASYNSVMMLGGNSVYGMSKSGVAAMTRSQAIEWAKYGFRSNALTPGHISTKLTTQLWDDPYYSKYMLDRIAMARPGYPEDMLGMSVLLASDASAYMSGQLCIVDGGCLAGGQPWEI
ncbi:MAG: SDR family oxidoreductase [Lachnospiraceae bacterium]|nr:SDR family oxidoreductase [Lachnospiraceae bacterium]